MLPVIRENVYIMHTLQLQGQGLISCLLKSIWERIPACKCLRCCCLGQTLVMNHWNFDCAHQVMNVLLGNHDIYQVLINSCIGVSWDKCRMFFVFEVVWHMEDLESLGISNRMHVHTSERY